ncbi:MAG: hypothetical protein EOO04_29725, partial [Chitinophagaceae bacterium]
IDNLFPDSIRNLYKVDLTRKNLSVATQGSQKARDFFINKEGETVAIEQYDERGEKHTILAKHGNKWVEIFSEETEIRNKSFVGLTADFTSLVFLERDTKNDTSSYNLMKLSDGSITRSIFAREDADIAHTIVDIQRVVYGVRYSGFTPSYKFFDAAIDQRVKDIVAQFPEQSVVLSDWSPDWKHIVVNVEGSNYADDYFLFSPNQNGVFLTSGRPQIKTDDINPIGRVTFSARDNLRIPTLLTIPRSKVESMKNLPAVIYPHGGPASHDMVAFDYFAQALAAQGYLVIQPQFRGSTGFGIKHHDAGFGEWGKKMQDDEHFVGLGEKTGNIDRKGSGFTNWNSDKYGYTIAEDPLYTTIPFYIGIHHGLNYGLFLDNTFQSDFNFGASNNRFSSFGARGGELNYYFIYHRRLADIINSYTYLTGKMPMPPLWSLGYQQNRYSYYPESEVMRIANTLREKRIPADGITLDIHYMDAYKLFTWNKDRFPDPLRMNTALNKIGFKTTVIVDPGIKVEKGAGAYERGIKDNVYLKYPDGQPYTGQVWPGWCNFPDFTSAKGRSWWHNEVKFFAESGVSGIWNDMNEIATWGQKMPDNVLFNYDGKNASHLGAHNVYGLQMARASYEGARKQFKERPFILTRSGYSGLQRYSALWTGDNRAEEDHMIAGVRLMTSLGLSGVAFSGMDIGGFTGGATTSLYTKWIQLGAFTPYYRNHTALNSKAAEPWTFGEDVLD